MRRRLANFVIRLSLFGLFLSFAAFSSGAGRPDILFPSLILFWLSWRVLRKPPERFDPSNRFRTLRRLGLINPGDEESS